MRGSVRQFAILLLAAAYAVLWTCGSAWHLATCTHCDHAGCESSHTEADSHCCKSHSGLIRCSHSHEKSRPVHQISADVSSLVENDGPPEAPHDSSNCEICQLFVQTLTFVSLVSIEVSPELVEPSVCEIPLTVPECELIPARSRGPPAIA